MGGHKGIPVRAIAVFALAAAIGVAGGLLGAGFQHALNWLQHVLIGPGRQLGDAVREHLSPLQTVLVPTAGGVLAGVLLVVVRRRGAPFGITDIIGLVALRKGTIRLRDSIVQIASSACTIGTGGSIGKEGANSQLAATFAAQLAKLFRTSARTRSVLLGCGVAAGMATSYNAPIAGAIFVMEAVLGNFAMDVMAPIVVASVLATILRRALIEYQPVYELSQADLGDLPWQLVLAALMLGVCCGVGGILFRRALLIGRRAFQFTRLPRPVVLGLGGLVIGLIGLFRPQAWGNGFEVIRDITLGDATVPIGLVLSLFVWKMVATVATVGSGGLGGIFTPNLVVGAAFGALFAFLLDLIAPTASPLAARQLQITFAFVGMAGLCAAVTHAPVTSVVLVFELTGHYELTLPIMLCSITASLVARMLDEDSYYGEALRQKGEELPAGLEELAIKTTYVRDVMRSDPVTVTDTATFDEVMEVLGAHRGDTIYVLDNGGGLVGRIQLQDVKNFINDPTLSSVVIAADLTRPAVTASPDDSLAALLPQFDGEVNEIAVTSASPRRLLGRVCQQDVLSGIRTEVLGQQRRTRFRDDAGKATPLVDLPAGWEFAEFAVPSEWHGLAVDNLPAAVLTWMAPVVVERARDDGTTERFAATQELVLQEGWNVLALCRSADLQRWREGERAVET